MTSSVRCQHRNCNAVDHGFAIRVVVELQRVRSWICNRCPPSWAQYGGQASEMGISSVNSVGLNRPRKVVTAEDPAPSDTPETLVGGATVHHSPLPISRTVPTSIGAALSTEKRASVGVQTPTENSLNRGRFTGPQSLHTDREWFSLARPTYPVARGRLRLRESPQ